MERYRNLPCIGVLRKELIAARMKVRVQFFSQLQRRGRTRRRSILSFPQCATSAICSRTFTSVTGTARWDQSILIGAGVEFVDREYVAAAKRRDRNHAAGARRLTRLCLTRTNREADRFASKALTTRPPFQLSAQA